MTKWQIAIPFLCCIAVMLFRDFGPGSAKRRKKQREKMEREQRDWDAAVRKAIETRYGADLAALVEIARHYFRTNGVSRDRASLVLPVKYTPQAKGVLFFSFGDGTGPDAQIGGPPVWAKYGIEIEGEDLRVDRNRKSGSECYETTFTAEGRDNCRCMLMVDRASIIIPAKVLFNGFKVGNVQFGGPVTVGRDRVRDPVPSPSEIRPDQESG